MGTTNRYPERVARAKWTPDEDLARELDKLVDLHNQKETVDAAYKAQLAKLAQPTGPVPIAYLAERLNLVRKTIYRHLGKSMT